MIKYLTEYNKLYDTISAKKENSDKSFSFHISSEFPEYALVPSNIYINNENKIIFKKSTLPDNWIRGNFFNSQLDENNSMRRLTQYDYDKACYEGKILTKYSDNGRFFEYVTSKLQQL